MNLLLLSPAMAQRVIQRRPLPPTVMAVSNTTEGCAYIFWHRIQKLRRSRVGVILGRIVAHEIGHLLMPERAHSIAGIMQPHLDLSAWAPAFLGDEVLAIRQRLAAAR